MIKVEERLDEKTIQIVKSTVPVLEEHGEEITQRFYQLLLTNNPELKNIFNQTNQHLGRQSAALANAVYAAATYIDNLEAILPVVKQISHKHRSLQVKPEHYPIVGENLLKAIQDVLGLEPNNEIITAWEKSYKEIAAVFIKVEKEMYQQTEKQSGGWIDFRDFKVVKKTVESDVITSFYLAPVDGSSLPRYQPGQYITIKADIEGQPHTHLRQYSLSTAPSKEHLRITVKREDSLENTPAGIVSTYLHTKVNEDSIVPISSPSGDFVLNTDTIQPLVLISGGVGLTPLLSMLETVVQEQPEREVHFIHAARNGNVHAMKDTVKQISTYYNNVHSYFIYENPTSEDRRKQTFDKKGYINLEWLQSATPKEASFYFCGPQGFMKAIYKMLNDWKVPGNHINYEFFGPAGSLEQ